MQEGEHRDGRAEDRGFVCLSSRASPPPASSYRTLQSGAAQGVRVPRPCGFDARMSDRRGRGKGRAQKKENPSVNGPRPWRTTPSRVIRVVHPSTPINDNLNQQVQPACPTLGHPAETWEGPGKPRGRDLVTVAARQAERERQKEARPDRPKKAKAMRPIKGHGL